MAKTIAERITEETRLHGGNRRAALRAIETSISRLDSIVAALRAMPLAPWIVIFGSAIREDGAIPGDIDAFVARKDVQLRGRTVEAADEFLRLALAGGYHGNYGWFDPFWLESNGTLLTRSDSYGESAWIKAGHKEAIIKEARKGTCLKSFRRRFADEFGAYAIAHRLPDVRESQ